MDSQDKAALIVDRMFGDDAFSQWLGIEIMEVSPGSCTLRMAIRPDMLNGFGIAHGGITYSLADSALAFASNSRGRHALSVETSISHTAPLHEGDTLTAAAAEEHLSNKIGVYRVELRDQSGKIVALFKGTVYRSSREWEI